LKRNDETCGIPTSDARSPHRRTGIATIALLPLLFFLQSCTISDGFFASAGPVAESQHAHFLSVLAWMAVVVLPVAIGLPFVAWRYRSGRGKGGYAPDWSYNRPIEILIWCVPVVVVVALAANLWRETIALDPYKPVPGIDGAKPLTIEVVAMDWKFLFLYPESGIATVNEIAVPAGRPLRFRLTSQTVMQSFFIPRLGGQIYAMAGMTTELNLRADEEGTYRGQNAQYNGRGFAEQKFVVHALSEADFARWEDEVKANGDELDDAGYTKLARPSVVSDARHYRSFPKDLFRNVIHATAGMDDASSSHADVTSKRTDAGSGT
jgi:cytochrome o ubiquinol oxidase subunit II